MQSERLPALAEINYTSGMASPWKNWVVVFISLWLPLQGYGAVAMPFCKHGPAMPDSSVAVPVQVDSQSGDFEHAHEGHAGMQHHDTAAGHQPADPGNSTGEEAGMGCNDCGACQLACAPSIVSRIANVVSLGSPVYDLLPVESLDSVSPEQLQRPPLTALI